MEDELSRVCRILGDALKVPEGERSAVDLAEQAVKTMEGLVFVLQEKDDARQRRDEERDKAINALQEIAHMRRGAAQRVARNALVAMEANTARTRDAERLATYRTALMAYADEGNWHVLDCNGELCDWIGGGEGPDLALRVLSGDTMAGWRLVAEDEIEEIEGAK